MLRFRTVVGQPVPASAPTDDTTDGLPPTSRLTYSGEQPGSPPIEIEQAKQLRQQLEITDVTVLGAAIESLDCSAPDPLHGQDDPDLPLVTCNHDDTFIYVLGPAFLTSDEIAGAETKQDPDGVGYIVEVTFTATGRRIWADFTTDHVGQQVAFVLDTDVVSAPEIQGAITGATQITGGQGGFSQQEAEQLADRLDR